MSCTQCKGYTKFPNLRASLKCRHLPEHFDISLTTFLNVAQMSSSLLPLPDCHLQLLSPAPLALQPAAHVAQLGLQPLGLGLLQMGSE